MPTLNSGRILFLLIGAILVSSLLFNSESYASPVNKKSGSTFYRLYLNTSSTQKNLQYFQCTVVSNPENQTIRHIPLLYVPVRMVNYGQMISNFNGLGILDTTADYINSYTFSAYHDPRSYYVNKKGFVDIFVSWPAYSVTCKTVSNFTQDRPLLPSFG